MVAGVWSLGGMAGKATKQTGRDAKVQTLLPDTEFCLCVLT
jgi:hypothetical protein